MRSLRVVAPPGPQNGTSVGQRSEQRFVEQLVVQAAIKALDEPVLLRLAGRDVVLPDAGLVRPAKNGIRSQLGAVAHWARYCFGTGEAARSHWRA
jgi:hypothetical protein